MYDANLALTRPTEMAESIDVGAVQTHSTKQDTDTLHTDQHSIMRTKENSNCMQAMSYYNDAVPPPCLAGMKIYNEAREEFKRIKKAHHNLAPTGCTPQFCQSGRATRLNEPRVGRDRPISEIQLEAVGFLKECREQGIIETDAKLCKRTREALSQIKESSIESHVIDEEGNQTRGLAGGVWVQTTKELEYGIRASWRNSRRCIMRSKFEQLTLCDLRHITSSREMAEAVVNGMRHAFNGGQILPTTFVFPPRRPLTRGPMLWNNQILAFAGYRQEDGSILGDPINVDLTDAVIELGWKPPSTKSRWDFLPLVAMADGEKPYILELPRELQRTIPITHPRYRKEFASMDLKWVLAPALSRLGFDIGGNQYTASPFIGWFMDAEIGVRNLADTFRYNVLPDIVEHLKLSDDPDAHFEDQPEFMRLAALSRAQTELNFAVYYSYLHERVTMIDTLTSSADYQKFDQERQEETGYRLPADPYWLAPPQGSIVPLWHQGAAPNYQPKPMICRHVQDPIKAWRRECVVQIRTKACSTTPIIIDRKPLKPRIHIISCSAGINASKMTKKLYDRLASSNRELNDPFEIVPDRALNTLVLADVGAKDLILVVASTTGAGEIPRNGTKFVKRYQNALSVTAGPRFSVFGNGDSTYGDTYNAAGIEIHNILVKTGCQPIFDHSFTGDTAIGNPDWASLIFWLDAVDHIVRGKIYQPKMHLLQQARLGQKALSTMITASLVDVEKFNDSGTMRVVLNIGKTDYCEMDHVKIMAPNNDNDVHRTLDALGLQSNQTLDWNNENAYDYLSMYVDLDNSFKTMNWYPQFNDLNEDAKRQLQSFPVNHVLKSLSIDLNNSMIEAICNDMPSIRPRVFSVASSPVVVSAGSNVQSEDKLVDVIVKANPNGRFSDKFINQAMTGTRMRVALSSPDAWPIIQRQPSEAPFIAITTGSGIGPVRACLQRRLAEAMNTRNNSCDAVLLPTLMTPLNSSNSDLLSGDGTESEASPLWSLTSTCTSEFDWSAEVDELTLGNDNLRGNISLFAGFKPEDTTLIDTITRPAAIAGLFDILALVPSNDQKVRVQDHLLLPHHKERLAELLKHPRCIVFVCANENAAEQTVVNLSAIAGVDIRECFGERYIEEVFRC